jgi:hypothetical protein
LNNGCGILGARIAMPVGYTWRSMIAGLRTAQVSTFFMEANGFSAFLVLKLTKRFGDADILQSSLSIFP